MVAPDSCERFPQVRVAARDVSKRGVENRFHVALYFVGTNRIFADGFFEKRFATTRRELRISKLTAYRVAVSTVAHMSLGGPANPARGRGTGPRESCSAQVVQHEWPLRTCATAPIYSCDR